jgi:hypothetical protein
MDPNKVSPIEIVPTAREVNPDPDNDSVGRVFEVSSDNISPLKEQEEEAAQEVIRSSAQADLDAAIQDTDSSLLKTIQFSKASSQNLQASEPARATHESAQSTSTVPPNLPIDQTDLPKEPEPAAVTASEPASVPASKTEPEFAAPSEPEPAPEKEPDQLFRNLRSVSGLAGYKNNDIPLQNPVEGLVKGAAFKPDESTIKYTIAKPIPKKISLQESIESEVPQIKSIPKDGESQPVSIPKVSVQSAQKIASSAQNPAMQQPGSVQPPQNPDEQAAGESSHLASFGNIKSIRTYESDVAEVMSRRRTSVASMAIAETKKAEKSEMIGNQPEKKETTHLFRNLVLTFISFIFIGGGLAGAYYLYTNSDLGKAGLVSIKKNPDNPGATGNSNGSGNVNTQNQAASSLVPADSTAVVQIDNMNTLTIISKLKDEAAKPQKPGTIKEIIPAVTEGNSKVRVSAPNMVRTLDISAPDILTRSLTNSWMLGVYSDRDGKNSAFVVTTNNFFQNVFAGMLQWEHIMPDDLRMYLFAKPPADVANVSVNSSSDSSQIGTGATSTAATSTAGSPKPGQETNVRKPDVLKGQFADRIVHNKDVREFIASDGSVLFLYSFIDTNKLVVAGSEAALIEILSRLDKQAFIR